MTIIENGTGNGNKMRVNANNRAYVQAVIETEREHATNIGDSYNINTGDIALTGTSESAIMYFTNDEDQDFIIDSIAVGIGTRSATVTDTAVVTLVRNPTGGDIITDASAVAMNQNRNFGSSKTLATTSVAYKGKDGGTVTGGNDIAQFYQSEGRLFASIDFILTKGDSVAIKIDLNTSGGANVYAALIGHVRDPNE